MRILRTTYSDKPSTVECQGQTVEVRATQIIVWASLNAGHVFPAIIDGKRREVTLKKGWL